MRTYENPVYPRSFPDPFILEHRGEYWAYCTGSWPGDRRFGILHSRDLVHWRPLAGALAPLLPGAEDWPCYWAPEVASWDGRFFLYYSVGDEARMEIRVAVSDRPEGPFEDSGRRLTSEPFAIDAHPFTASDGSRWLFYATDFLTHRQVGTGTVADRLLDPWTLTGSPRPITRALYDWQIYHPNRAEKGGVRWYTVEGPFVLERKGLYYQMFSGGNWQNPTYGVSYAVSDTLEAEGEWDQAADGVQIQPVLRTLPGRVVGPGHNSVVRGPDRRQLWCVYHRWDLEREERVMAIDPLDWAGDRLLVLGPSTGPRPAPASPTLANLFDGEGGDLGPEWRVSGSFRSGGGETRGWPIEPGGVATARRPVGSSAFLVEVSVKVSEGGVGGIGLFARGGDAPDLALDLTSAGEMLLTLGGRREERLETTGTFPRVTAGAFHTLRLEVDGPRVRLALDGLPLWTGRLATSPTAAAEVALFAREEGAAFSGFAVTLGWEDLFFPMAGDPADSGWETLSGQWRQTGRELMGAATGGTAEAEVAKGPLFADYELVVNVRLLPDSSPEGGWGVRPARTATHGGPLLALVRTGDSAWALALRETGPERLLPFPAGFDPALSQQIRLKKSAGCLSIAWQDHSLGETAVSSEPSRPGLHLRQAAAGFDAVRLTVLS
jgi:GH43 family beta-xylosidase